ncbi:MAG TPA: hypothetical protein V6C57_12720 [Coleofasciculaceae cyanobacterium]
MNALSTRTFTNANLLSSPMIRRSSSLFDIDKDFGTLSSSKTKTASSTASKQDSIYYQFTLDKRSKAQVTLQNNRSFNPFTDLFKKPSVFAAVLNESGSTLQTLASVDPGKTKKFTTNKFDSGTYYLKVSVKGSNRSVDYQLQIRRASSGLFGTGLFG